MQDFPTMTDHTGASEPVPRRLRGYLGGACVFDTVAAVYVWDSPKYPAYHVPLADVDPQLLTDDGRPRRLSHGPTTTYSLNAGESRRHGAVRAYTSDAEASVSGLARIEWNALDAWFEEDEQVWVHPRNPYTRVDALRSSRHVRVELNGRVLAESGAPVMVFETGLPTRYYLNRTSVDLGSLSPSDTITACPYKGRTTAYWSATVGDTVVPDIAWSYDFPTRALAPIAGLVAFYNEHTQITVDGRPASSATADGCRVSDTPLADHALLSDCRSVALITAAGSVDWLCWPRMDSSSVFGRLLDPAAGHFRVAPEDNRYEAAWRYRGPGLVLQTIWTGPGGELEVTDGLALGAGERGHDLGRTSPGVLLRRVRCTAGEVAVAVEFAPRPEFGLVHPVLTARRGRVVADGGSSVLQLSTNAQLLVAGSVASGTTVLRQGQELTFALEQADAWAAPPPPAGQPTRCGTGCMTRRRAGEAGRRCTSATPARTRRWSAAAAWCYRG